MEGRQKVWRFNVGGCVFSIPVNRLAHFQDSLLQTSASAHGDTESALFIDGDASAFSHVYYYISTGMLTKSCALETNILHELAAGLQLPSLKQALESLQHVTDCRNIHHGYNSKAEPECSIHQVMPQGLVSTPLVAKEEDVLYCFVPLEEVRHHPGLVTQDNLLWLCEDVAVIECSSHLFRFIANFLRSGTILLPEEFSDYGELCDEARAVGMTEFIDKLQELSDWRDRRSPSDSCSEGQACCAAEPLYVLSLSLLVKYPDSSLGQLCVESSLEGSRLYITGTGVLFQHVENWLGTSRLPLTRSAEELRSLCTYLDNQDGVYLAIRQAMQELFHMKETTGYTSALSWSATVSTFSLYKVVKVYAGTNWYATYFKTLIKHPELLSNSTKSKWIVFGESLLVKCDGQMFRHVLNFLRCGRLLLPADFREWPLLCQEIEAFQIPALSRALQISSDYRAWCKTRKIFSSCNEAEIILDSCIDSEKSLDEYELQSFLRDNGLFSSETSGMHSENEAEFVCVGASGISEARPSATEKIERTKGVLRSLVCHSPPAKRVSSAHEELIKNKSKLSGNRSESEDSWHGEMASILLMLQESMQKNDSPLLKRLALLMETSALSKTQLMQMLSELSDTEKSALTVTLVSAFRSNCQSWKEQQQETATDGELAHTEERLEHNTHTVRELGRDQMVMQRASVRSSLFPVTNITAHVGGCVLSVDHPAVLGRGEAGGYFTHSIIYTDEQSEMMQPGRKEGNNVAFAYFNMSYEEMVYARECHAFLTGNILDSSRLQLQDCMVNLVHHLWTGRIGADNFVHEFMTGQVGSQKQLEKKRKLLQWVKFTLPLAKRYTESIRELVRKISLHTVILFPSDLLEVTIPTQSGKHLPSCTTDPGSVKISSELLVCTNTDPGTGLTFKSWSS